MERLYWPLTVLSRSIHYQNLSAAAEHVGLSQPQLSRLIAQIERELDISLLDRSVKRRSAWTPAAHELAELLRSVENRLEYGIRELQEESKVTEVRIGTLEGLMDLALFLGEQILEESGVTLLQVDVFDLHELDEKFLNNDLDVLLTSRQPGNRKLHKLIPAGYQTLSPVHSNQDFKIYSPFQYSRLTKRQRASLEGKVIISNSLYFRRQWLEVIGGTGDVPSKIQNRKTKSPVYVIGQNGLPDQWWQQIQTFIGRFHTKSRTRNSSG